MPVAITSSTYFPSSTHKIFSEKLLWDNNLRICFVALMTVIGSSAKIQAAYSSNYGKMELKWIVHAIDQEKTIPLLVDRWNS